MGFAVPRRMVERGGEMIGERCNDLLGVGHHLSALFEHLDAGADADRHHESDDENRNRAAQDWLCAQEAAICGVGD